MARKKTLKTLLSEFIDESVKTFGFKNKADYLSNKASKNYVVMEVSGFDENDNQATYSPIMWDDGKTLMVLNTEALANEEAAEYTDAKVITELKLYEILGVA